MVTLSKLQIGRYRNVVPDTSLRFTRGTNILLGPNGGGKTTLLNLISMVLSSDFSRVENEPLSVSYSLEFATCTLDVKLDIQPAPLPVRPGIAEETIREPAEYEYSIRLRDAETGVELTAIGNRAGMRHGNESKLRPAIPPFIPNFIVGVVALPLLQGRQGPARDAALKLMAALSWGVPRFDESLDGFEAMSGIVAQGRSGLPASMGFLIVQQKRLVIAHRSQGIPREIISCVRKQLDSGTVPSSVVLSHEQLHFLRSAVQMMGFPAGEYVAELQRKQSLADGSEELQYGQFGFRFSRADGSFLREGLLSYGQKRLLAFLYYLGMCPDSVIADELVNGFHHAWIARCVELIGKRQAFLSSQNPLLLDHLEFTSARDVRTRLIQCRLKDTSSGPQMVWGNMALREAQSFYSAYTAGIEHVGEILRSRGLW